MIKITPLNSDTILLQQRSSPRSTYPQRDTAAQQQQPRGSIRRTKFKLAENLMMAAVVGAILVVSVGLAGAKRVYKLVRVK